MSDMVLKQPETLDEAVDYLKSRISQPVLDKLKNLDERSFTGSVHMSTGMNMRNAWCLWWHPNHKNKEWPKEKPALVEWFNSIGIYHADDMSGIIMTSFYRDVHGLDRDIEGQVKMYQDHWKRQGYDDGIPR